MTPDFTTFNAVKPDVYIGTALDSLTLNAALYCDYADIRLGPQISSVRLSYDYGRIARNSSGSYASEAALDLRGKFVQVKLAESVLFTGIIAEPENMPEGTWTDIDENEVPQGRQAFTAYDLSYLLARVPVNKTYYGAADYVTTVFPFNGSGRLVKNRAAAAVYFDYSGSGANWTAADILNYLKTYFFSLTGITWALGGAYASLQYQTTQADPDGKSVRDILAEIIKPERGFAWTVTVSGTTATLNVISTTAAAVTVGAVTVIPANADTFSIQSDIQTSRLYRDVTIRQIDECAYHKIRVSSEPIRVMATFKLGTDTGGMAADWTSAQESAYNAAAEIALNDETWQKVFCGFRLSASWDKKDQAGTALIPAIDEATGAVTWNTANKTLFQAHPFDRELPVLNDPADEQSNYKKPFVLVKNTEGDYEIGDKMKTEIPVGLSLYDDAPGILLKTKYNHRLGLNHYTGAAETIPIGDYADCVATVSFYTDTVLACQIDGITLPEGATARVKEIYLPNYHYWIARTGTTVDRQMSLAVDTVYRNDWSKLQEFANIAKIWYGRVRNTVGYNYDKIEFINRIGHIVTSIYSGGGFTPAGTIVSTIAYDFISQSVRVATEFADLDFAFISRNSQKKTEKQLAARISALEDRTRQMDVRPAPAGSPAAAYNGYFAPSDTSSGATKKVTIAAGKTVVGATVADVAEQEFTVTETTYIYCQITYSGGYVSALGAQNTYPDPAAGTWKKLLTTVEYDAGTINIERNHCGPVHYEG